MDNQSWISYFRELFKELPLILAGPVLRHTTPNSVTVWVALKAACTVELKIYNTAIAGERIESCLLSGQRSTVALGEYLHVVAVTACASGYSSPDSSSQLLQSDQIYAYDLRFSTPQAQINLQQALNCSTLPDINLSYFPHQKPTFALPPEQLEHLRMVQGSCRKPHGKGFDALPILDDLIAATAREPRGRPHQLFLTGDQIYSDNVAEPTLWIASALGDALLGWQEQLPIEQHKLARGSLEKQNRTCVPTDLPPGTRADIATTQAGFTAGLRNQRHKATSHLFGLGEFYAQYLLAWSPVCWAVNLPKGQQLYGDRQSIQQWNKSRKAIQQFVQTLPKVRRALANLPTYMICDDHEVSDDWNMNRAWCLRVLARPLGRRVVQNALLSYALFQGWGNTPEQFESGKSGEKLLEAAQQWSKSAGSDFKADQAIATYVGMPSQDSETGLPIFVQEGSILTLDRHPDALNWHYTVESQCHRVIVLDTRTRRGYPLENRENSAEISSAIAPPLLLCPSAIEQQVILPLQHSPAISSEETTFLIAPTNLFGLKAIDWIHHWQLRRRQVFSTDVGDAWNMNTNSLAQLLKEVFARRRSLIVLSGDIHYSATVRLSYQDLDSEKTPAVLVQLTSSALKNEEFVTRLIHTRLKDWLLPEPVRQWMGWNDPPRMIEQSKLRSQGEQSLPDWRCSTVWIPRRSTRPLSKTQPASRYLWYRFWYWLQDGQEVVGFNNLAMVSFLPSSESHFTIIHTLYWRSPWQADDIFYSRFECDLKPQL